jgi:DNA-binding MarR family transcriptional regulator
MKTHAKARRQNTTGRASDAIPSHLTELLGFQLRMAQVALYRDFAASMAKLNLTQSQVAVMEIIAWIPGVSQADVASSLSTDRATMLVIVDRLAERGLINRHRSLQDRRRQELHLTASGTRLLVRIRAAVAKHEKRFTERFTPQEFKSLMEGLRRLHAGGESA